MHVSPHNPVMERVWALCIWVVVQLTVTGIFVKYSSCGNMASDALAFLLYSCDFKVAVASAFPVLC